MIICKGEGTLMINPSNGDVRWAEVGASLLTLCRQQDYKDADLLASLLGLDIALLAAPPCPDCAHYEECCKKEGDLSKERDELCCVGVDEAAVSSAITGALAALSAGERDHLLLSRT